MDRKYSINLGCAHAKWEGAKINFLDTPDSPDFQGEALAVLAAADGALCVVSAKSGVGVGTEQMLTRALERGAPVLFVVTMMDKKHADFDAVYRKISYRLTSKVIPIEVPVGDRSDFHGIVNLFDAEAHMYSRGSRSGEYAKTSVPDAVRRPFDRYRAELIETIAATDDTFLERFLNSEDIERGGDHRHEGIDEAAGALSPLLCQLDTQLRYTSRAFDDR